MKISKQEVTLVNFMGSDNAVVDAARVSFHKGADNYTPEQNQKLISYLAKHGHWSPFSHCFLSFRVKAPVFVARQLAKHVVGLSWNEVSRRYVDEEPEFYFPEVWRGKPVNAKQGSTGILDGYCTESSNYQLQAVLEQSIASYNKLLGVGVAPEQARMVLPLNTMTEWIWSGSLMAFARVCNQRLDSHAQHETQEIAHMIYNLVPKEFEHSWKALVDNNRS